jgi:hypothetical protein
MLRWHQSKCDPFRYSTMSSSGRRGVAGNGSALTGAQPIRNSICGKPLIAKTSICTASRVSDFQRFGDWAACQTERGCPQQHQAGGFAGTLPGRRRLKGEYSAGMLRTAIRWCS